MHFVTRVTKWAGDEVSIHQQYRKIICRGTPNGAYSFPRPLSLSPAGYTTESVMHGQCDARPMVTFPANGRYQFILLGEQRHIPIGHWLNTHMPKCKRRSLLRRLSDVIHRALQDKNIRLAVSLWFKRYALHNHHFFSGGWLRYFARPSPLIDIVGIMTVWLHSCRRRFTLFWKRSWSHMWRNQTRAGIRVHCLPLLVHAGYREINVI